MKTASSNEPNRPTSLGIDYDKFYKKGISLKDSYTENSPYPHIMIDGLFDENLLEKISEECSQSFKDIDKHFYGSVGKHATNKEKYWGAYTTALLHELNSDEFIQFLEKLTGIEGLVCDPYYEGGGIHETKKGGFLKVHTDFNYHKKLELDRRVNLLLYLNPEWDESYGGHLELWDQDMKECHAKILPILNRTVIFTTTDFSYHGHPEPLTCPDHRSRKSLALYYYSDGRPDTEVKFDKSSNTNYQERPGEAFDYSTKKSFSQKIKKKLKKLFN